MARSDSKLKNLPRETLDELWDLKCPADAEQKALGLVEICGVIREQYKIEIGKSALSEFFQWLEVQRRMWARESLIDNIKEVLAKDASLSPEQVKAAGQRLFMADGILERDAKTFAMAANLENDETRLRQKDAELNLRKEGVEILKRKLGLLEAKAAEAKAKLEALSEAGKSKGGLSPETLAAIEEAAGLL